MRKSKRVDVIHTLANKLAQHGCAVVGTVASGNNVLYSVANGRAKIELSVLLHYTKRGDDLYDVELSNSLGRRLFRQRYSTKPLNLDVVKNAVLECLGQQYDVERRIDKAGETLTMLFCEVFPQSDKPYDRRLFCATTNDGIEIKATIGFVGDQLSVVVSGQFTELLLTVPVDATGNIDRAVITECIQTYIGRERSANSIRTKRRENKKASGVLVQKLQQQYRNRPDLGFYPNDAAPDMVLVQVKVWLTEQNVHALVKMLDGWSPLYKGCEAETSKS